MSPLTSVKQAECCNSGIDDDKKDLIVGVHVFYGIGPREDVPSVYGLDVTDVSRWEQTALDPALQVLEHLSKVRLLPSCLLLSSSSITP